MTQTYKISGMTCSGCEQTVHNVLSNIAGVSKVTVDRTKERAEIEMDTSIPIETFQATLSDTLYQITETVPKPKKRKNPIPDKEELDKNRELVFDYVTAVGLKQYDKLLTLLHHDFEFNGAITLRTPGDYINMLKEHSNANDVVLNHNIKATFVDGNEACVIYEVVTNQPVDPVPFVEWIAIEDGKILSTRVQFDRYSMRQLMQQL